MQRRKLSPAEELALGKAFREYRRRRESLT